MIVMDRFSEQVSIISVIERIVAESFPIVVPRLWCLYELTRENADPSRRDGTVILKLGDAEILRGPVDINFVGTLRTRALLAVHGLVIPGPGTLRASLELDGEMVGHWDIACEGRPAQIRLPLQDSPGGAEHRASGSAISRT
jgi:hypothetical protein